MGKATATVAIALLVLSLAGCAQGGSQAASDAPGSVQDEAKNGAGSTSPQEEESMLNICIGDTILQATLEDNSSAAALEKLLQDGPITVSLHDYGDFEKVGALGKSLPTNDMQITTEPGDVILYQGDQITIYYDHNTWSFTRLAKIKGVTRESLLEILGQGDVEATLSLG